MEFKPELANALRFLSVDAVEKAQSGHPGMPLGMADIASLLWLKFLRHNPANPTWFNRDRFVLSNGHGCMLLYALLHLTGYKLDIDALKHFRQLHSKTPGHPEITDTPGVEATTGPLGQGLTNAVGMALAEKILAAEFNEPQLPLVDHYTYAFVGDGCLMEGISHEACSLAGTWGLNKLIVFYDSNGISIDGHVDTWFRDNTAQRFRAYHWHVIEQIDGHDPKAIEKAIRQAQAQIQQPTLIICQTTIGLGSVNAGSEKTHGSPLGKDDVEQLRHYFNWPYPAFVIPDTIYKDWNHQKQGQAKEDAWLAICHQYQTLHPVRYQTFLRRINGDLPDEWSKSYQLFLQTCLNSTKPMASRKASQLCLNAMGPLLPELLGGSADLTGSNNTDWSGCEAFHQHHFTGNYIHYGVREFGMAAIMNGIALHGGFIPYGGTFLVFADYAKNAIRLSALMQKRVIYVLSHDSIGLGEDGPTHQPVEQAAMLRMTPNVQVWRPATLLETAIAWEHAIKRQQGPSCLLLSRQNLQALPHHADDLENISRGGYILHDSHTKPEVILLATGSELQIAMDSATSLANMGIKVRVVSLPCVELFLLQPMDYQHKVLPPTIRKRVAIEASATAYWYRFTGLDGAVIGLDRFGASAPAAAIYENTGITVEHTIAAVKKLIHSTGDMI